ncbi:unnamed protein product [Chilo suppressalis]|uniref:Uncharacterized protein n=1 Tax=Chilo suppressalis TaxID=168631 RepID=A0ABN8AWA7_CHISP|nr:unnamed protein product [Chilo suppressalis]
MRESSVLKGVTEAAYRGQTRREAGGVPLHYLRAGVLLEELADDAYIHLPQVEARRDGPNPVFLVTTWTELARPSAELV